MLTRKPAVGGKAGFSGACGPPSAWRVLRPLPCPRRFSAKTTRGPAPGAHVFELLSLFTVTVTSLHPPRLHVCRLTVFSEKLTFSLLTQWRISKKINCSNAKIKQKSIWIGVDGSLHHDRWGFVVLCHFHPDGSGHAETHASRGYRRPSCTVWCYSLGQFPLGQIPLHRLASCPHGACRLCHSLTVD